MKTTNERITINPDKALITEVLGKRLYANSIDLMRELISNAYDADATEVNIVIDHDAKKIVVHDNGAGMNKNELEGYFRVGASDKRQNKVSPKFGRNVRGEFGIGKFAALSSTDCFEISTTQNHQNLAVKFLRDDFTTQDGWDLPLRHSTDRTAPNGTVVTLHDANIKFTEEEVISRLRDIATVDNFVVHVNGKRVEERSYAGRRIPVNEPTKFGNIEGEIIISNTSFKLKEAGIKCKVKGAVIKTDLFGYDGSGHGVNRIVGYVNADFLPFTTSRDEFLIDTEEFKVFYEVMKRNVGEAMKQIKSEYDRLAQGKHIENLRKANKKITEGLKRLPHLRPKHEVLVSKKALGTSDNPVIDAIKNYRRSRENGMSAISGDGSKEPRGSYNKTRSGIRGVANDNSDLITKKIKNDYGFNTVLYDGAGSDEVSYYDKNSNSIYVNQEHKLYKYFSDKGDQHEQQRLIEVIVAEIVFLTNPEDVRQFMHRQQELLSSIFSLPES